MERSGAILEKYLLYDQMWDNLAKGIRVCKDRSKWRSLVSAYPCDKKAWASVYRNLCLNVFDIYKAPKDTPQSMVLQRFDNLADRNITLDIL